MRWISALIALSVVLSGTTPSGARGRPLMAWSASLNLIAIGVEDQVRLYDGGTQRLVAVLEGKGAPLTALAWQPEGDLLATGDANGWLCLWSAAAFTSECRLLEDFVLRALAWQPSGDLLVGASGDQIRLWQAPSLLLSRAWSAEGIVTALAWQAESLAVGGALRGTYEQGFLALYDRFGALQQRYTAEMRPPLSLQSLPADRVGVSAPFDVFVWQRATQQSVPLYLPLREGEAVRFAAWSADGARVRVALNERLLCFAEGEFVGEIALDVPVAALAWQDGAPYAAILTEEGGLRFVEVARCR
ncbi:MAG: WD40 repeat domain-containing protein [Aggregatilineales bacterium]